MDDPEIAKYTETNLPGTGSTKRKLWKLISRPTDQGAVENIGLRRFRKCVKGIFTRHLKNESSESPVISTESRWLKPFKRVWKRKTKATYVRLPSVTASTTSPSRSARSQSLQTRQKSPPVLGTGVLRKQTSSQRSPRDTLVESTNATINTRSESRHVLNGPSSHTLPERPLTWKEYHALRKAHSDPACSALKRKDSLDAQVLIDPSTSHNTYSASSAHPTPATDDFQLKNSATSSDRAEYARLMKVCFKQSARRTPIPGSWRRTVPRAYVARAPMSPYRQAGFAVEKRYRRRVIRVYPTLPMRQRCSSDAAWLQASRTLPYNWTVRDSEAETASSHSSSTSETVVEEMESLNLDEEDADEKQIPEGLSNMPCDAEEVMELIVVDESDGDTSDEDVWYDVSENPSFEETSGRF